MKKRLLHILIKIDAPDTSIKSGEEAQILSAIENELKPIFEKHRINFREIFMFDTPEKE